MKHLLNDLSPEEKNRILEQYDNSLIVETSRFKKLLKSSLGNVKPLMEKDGDHELDQHMRQTHSPYGDPMDEFPFPEKKVNGDNNQKAEQLSKEIITDLEDKVYNEEFTRISDVTSELIEKISKIMEDNGFTPEYGSDEYSDGSLIKSDEFEVGIEDDEEYNDIRLKFDPLGDDKEYIDLDNGGQNFGDDTSYHLFCKYEQKGGVEWVTDPFGGSYESYEEDSLSIDIVKPEVLKNLILNILNSKKNKI